MLTAAFVIAGWISLYIAMRVMLAQNIARLRQEFQREIAAVESRFDTVPPVALTVEMAHESGNAIAAVAAAIAAKKVHVRAVQPQQTHPVGDPWAQQGRANVQSSHDIAQRGH
jgi:hypothetical protein